MTLQILHFDEQKVVDNFNLSNLLAFGFQLFTKKGTYLGFCCAWPACLQLALRTLVDEPVRSRVANIAVPQDEGGITLDHLEAVIALARLCHDCLPGGRVRWPYLLTGPTRL